LILIALLTLLGLIEGERPAAAPVENRWAEPTRGILAQRCGQCHLPNLPTSVPRALAVFDLTEEPWYGRLKPDQYEDLLARVKSIHALTEYDRSVVESFVRCARDHDCPRTDP
jgi:mono/diheme cytochrome c family protein